ncbi:hypothetical protein ACFPYJ_05570 [Paenibacillus solisilvae]|uniref:Uncharacterized protein n=1 Tax=Paenibacillus solisilvae TaxID=2486751 RepID=A0ABW0VUD6_9BACL
MVCDGIHTIQLDAGNVVEQLGLSHPDVLKVYSELERQYRAEDGEDNGD